MAHALDSLVSGVGNPGHRPVVGDVTGKVEPPRALSPSADDANELPVKTQDFDVVGGNVDDQQLLRITVIVQCHGTLNVISQGQ